MIPIKERCYAFSLKMIRFLKSRNWDKLSMVLVYQLMRSAASIGANVTEAVASSSRNEFKRYYEIALKSSNESLYWLNLVRDSHDLAYNKEWIALTNECLEICKMLAASVKRLKGIS